MKYVWLPFPFGLVCLRCFKCAPSLCPSPPILTAPHPSPYCYISFSSYSCIISLLPILFYFSHRERKGRPRVYSLLGTGSSKDLQSPAVAVTETSPSISSPSQTVSTHSTGSSATLRGSPTFKSQQPHSLSRTESISSHTSASLSSSLGPGTPRTTSMSSTSSAAPGSSSRRLTEPSKPSSSRGRRWD